MLPSVSAACGLASPRPRTERPALYCGRATLQPRAVSPHHAHTHFAPLNNDTLYSLAWLDLSKQPQVLHAPAIKHRFWEFELVDPWTNNFFNMTSAHKQLGKGDFDVTGGGNWAVVGPGFTGRLPRGAIRVNAPYSRVWVIGRTYIRGPSDLAGVHRIQAKYAITPLSRFGTGYTARAPSTSSPARPIRRSPGHSPARTRSRATPRSAGRC